MIPIVSKEFTQVTREQVLIEMIEEDLRLHALAATLDSVFEILGANRKGYTIGKHLGECVIDLLGVPRECSQGTGKFEKGDFSRDSFDATNVLADFVNATMPCEMTKEELDKAVTDLAPKVLKKYKSVAKKLHKLYPELMLPSIIPL